MEATNQPTPVILSESELAEIEARSANRPKIGYLETGIGSLRGGEDAITLLTVDIDVLCQTVRALRERLAACEGSRRVHELDNHHNALACGYCSGPLKDELTRLKKLMEKS